MTSLIYFIFGTITIAISLLFILDRIMNKIQERETYIIDK